MPPRTKLQTEGNGAATAEAAPKKAGMIYIPEFNFRTVEIRVIGLTPLVVHAFPEKERKRMMEARQTDQSTVDKPKGGKRTARPVRNFEEEYHESLYPIEDGSGYGFPVIGFKRGLVGACRQSGQLDMTLANRILFVHATCQSRNTGCIRLEGTPERRDDTVRLSGIDRPPDHRVRGQFWPWATTLPIEFNATMISLEGVMRLLMYAGKCEGIGEMRPSAPKKPDNYGQYRIATEGDGP